VDGRTIHPPFDGSSQTELHTAGATIDVTRSRWTEEIFQQVPIRSICPVLLVIGRIAI